MLTKQQLNCYNAIKRYNARNHYMPSYEEIADMMGLKSKGGVNRLIKGLEERGALVRLPGRARAIALRPLHKPVE